MNKEGIMEDNRKGTWEDVTGECTVDLSEEEKGTVNVRHPDNAIRLVLRGSSMERWAVQGGATFLTEEHENAANSYRVVDNPKSNSFRIEHFIPDPKEEWVDVTMDCEPCMYLAYDESESSVEVKHEGCVVVAFGGGKPFVPSHYGYRVTFSTGGVLTAGAIKVEKRND